MAHRVVHWGTGATGRHALAAILDRDDLELVGHYVFNAAKHGRDSGELIGRDPVGIAATQDLDALIALKPDVVTYFGNGVRDSAQTTQDIARFLANGINVVTSSLASAIHPHDEDDSNLIKLREACRAGNASFYASGVDPGFATGMLSVAALSAAHQIDCLRLQEFANYGNYPDEQTGRDIWGFGLPLDAQTLVSTGVLLRSSWRGTIEANAHALGWHIEELRTKCVTAPARKDYETAIGQIVTGTTSAVWFQLIGVIKGEEKIILEHVNWIDAGDIPEGWPPPPYFRGDLAETSYRICVEGQPAYDIELQMADGDKDGLGITAMHCINAIPMVVHAPAGIIDQCQIKPYGPAGAPA